MKFIKTGTLFEDTHTVEITDDEMAVIYTALETTLSSYEKLVSISGENFLPSEQKRIFEDMMILRETIKNELL